MWYLVYCIVFIIPVAKDFSPIRSLWYCVGICLLVNWGLFYLSSYFYRRNHAVKRMLYTLGWRILLYLLLHAGHRVVSKS